MTFGSGISDKAFSQYAVGAEELLRVLTRPLWADLSPVQEARARAAYQKAWDATAQPGELWSIVTGERDDDLKLTAVAGGQHVPTPRDSVRAAPRTSKTQRPG